MVISWVACVESVLCSLGEHGLNVSVEWEKDQAGEEWGKWAALAVALFLEEVGN